MSIGCYGTTIPIHIANVDIPNLVDISFVYHETRSYDSLSNGKFKHLDSSILTQAKREQEEKDRMYREIIKKQQAAINKQKIINRELEEAIRRAQAKNESSKKDIDKLKEKIKHLQEVIDLLTEQMNAFGNAA